MRWLITTIILIALHLTSSPASAQQQPCTPGDRCVVPNGYYLAAPPKD